MHPALKTTGHRPWSLPVKPWTWRQSWMELAFIHYRVAAEPLRKRLPDGVRLQEFDGSAWAGLVPFRMVNVTRRPLPNMPFFSSFLELNLRTYVEVDAKPGVWFFSLDATSWPAVLAGRHFYDLPYFRARMRQTHGEDGRFFSSMRHSGTAGFAMRYRPVGEAFFAAPGSFEHWMAERYCLYSFSKNKELSRIEVHHAPWPLQHVEAALEENHVLAAADIEPVCHQPLCHFSTGVHVVTFPREKMGNA